MSQSPDKPASGIIVLNKPIGHSSAHYVYRLRPILGIRKVGHAGTLDPFADGVLIACLGDATKLVERMMSLEKHYRTTIRLGVTNETFDPETDFITVPNVTPPETDAIDSALHSFTGWIDQVPPIFSAVKLGGLASYKRAIRGDSIHPAPRRVWIGRLARLRYDWPFLELEIVCGKGTYIRSIARDLGLVLGAGACCQTLTRLGVGPFRIENSIDLMTARPEDLTARILSIESALPLLEQATASSASHPPPNPGQSTSRI